MSGVFGVLDSKRDTPIEPLLTKMGARMSHREWYVVETYSDEDAGVGLGRIGIGIFNRTPQPAQDEASNLVVFFCGELYNTLPIRDALEAEGYVLRNESYEELVLRLYQAKGLAFAQEIEGPFVTCIWDAQRSKLFIVNDRFSRYPTFYAHYKGRLIFAPELKGILQDEKFDKRLNLTALAEYVRFDRMLGEKTFFDGIEYIPGGSVLTYGLGTGDLKIEKYWDYTHIPPEISQSTPFDQVVIEARRLLRQAFERLTAGNLRAGVYLSGGLDSRTALGMARKFGPVVSITYGARNSRDVVYARQLAKKAHSPHYLFEFKDGRWVQENVNLHMELTEGLHTWLHMHGISTLPVAKELIDYNLTGFFADIVIGSRVFDALAPRMAHLTNDTAFLTYLFGIMNQKASWPCSDEAEERVLYAPELFPQMQGRAFESLRTEANKLSQFEHWRRYEYFTLWHQTGRRTHYHVVYMRSHIEARYPFHDYALFDFMYSLPLEMRYASRLHIAIINRDMPELAMVPRESTDQLITDRRVIRSGHALIQKVKNRVNRHIAPIFPQKVSLYADYENWLRTDLRDWAESILFDKRTLERGIFNPDALRALWERHLSGRELHTIGKIAPIMTYEMMLRRFYD